MLQHLHEQDGALIFGTHLFSFVVDDEHVDQAAHPQLTYVDKNKVSVFGTYTSSIRRQVPGSDRVAA